MIYRIVIFSRDNSWGLSKDIQLIQETLTKVGRRVTFHPYDKAARERYHVAIHSEIPSSRNYRKANVNLLLPNQEWFPKEWVNAGKRRFHGVLCKTKLAVDIFTNQEFKNVAYTGFTSENSKNHLTFREKIPEFLHIAGNSRFKNTEAVIDCWRNNPSLPTLHLFNSYENLFDEVRLIDNIDYIYGRVSKREIIEAQNKYLFHVQPSMAEGFGHVVWEGLSTGAIVFTLDASPMNEVISTIKVEGERWQPHNLGILYKPVQGALFYEIEKVLGLDPSKWSGMSRQAEEEWFVNDIRFQKRFEKEVKKWFPKVGR